MPKVTEKPAVWDSRKVDVDDKDSDWVVVNTRTGESVRLSNDEYKERFTRSRAKVEEDAPNAETGDPDNANPDTDPNV